MESSHKTSEIPRAPLYLLGLCALIAFLYIARDILVPLVFAGLFAIMLSSLVKRLLKRGVSRILAVALTVIPAILILLALSVPKP